MKSLFLNASEVKLLKALVEGEVEFLIVGGHAVQFHGHLRPAKDLDVWYSWVGQNPKRVMSALAKVGLYGPHIIEEALAKPRLQIHIDGEFHTELLTFIEGVTFEEAYAERVSTYENGIRVPVISKRHLIQSKRALSRPQDLEDVKALENETGSV